MGNFHGYASNKNLKHKMKSLEDILNKTDIVTILETGCNKNKSTMENITWDMKHETWDMEDLFI